MIKELFLLADKIRFIREKHGMTQAELARNLGLTRSSVNSWEMGLSVPSTQYIIELAKLFGVSTDYLLGLNYKSAISVDGLTEKEVSALIDIVNCFKENKKNSGKVN